MIRFILALFGRDNYEPCLSCKILKEQLALANEEKRYLTDTLVNILQPKTAPQNLTELEPIKPKAMIWSRRRAELEEADRIKAGIVRDSPFVAKADDSKQSQTEKEEEVSNG